MQTDRPCPGQHWKHGSIRIRILAVGPDTVTFEEVLGGRGRTCVSLNDFLSIFTPCRSEAA